MNTSIKLIILYFSISLTSSFVKAQNYFNLEGNLENLTNDTLIIIASKNLELIDPNRISQILILDSIISSEIPYKKDSINNVYKFIIPPKRKGKLKLKCICKNKGANVNYRYYQPSQLSYEPVNLNTWHVNEPIGNPHQAISKKEPIIAAEPSCFLIQSQETQNTLPDKINAYNYCTSLILPKDERDNEIMINMLKYTIFEALKKKNSEIKKNNIHFPINLQTLKKLNNVEIKYRKRQGNGFYTLIYTIDKIERIAETNDKGITYHVYTFGKIESSTQGLAVNPTK